MERLYSALIDDHFKHNRQMLFMMGPRQSGKTTTAQRLSERWPNVAYYNWDNEANRSSILEGADFIAQSLRLDKLTADKPMVVFDEIHKYANWKNFLKGFYDSYPNKAHILVTGSARLDVYQRGGDSLMGRYFILRHHPLSTAEIIRPEVVDIESGTQLSEPSNISDEHWNALLKYGGYPDPYLKANLRFYNRWKQLRIKQILQEDLRDLSRIMDLDQVGKLAELLALDTGQLVNYTSLSKKLRATDKTVKSWIKMLESLYYCFNVKPWSKNISRSLIKDPKYYLWDWSLIKDRGAHSENFIACHLLKAVHYWTDCGYGEYELYFLRDKDQREVDFLVVCDGKPWMLVEVKSSASAKIAPALNHFQMQLQAKYAIQVALDMPYVNTSCFIDDMPIIVPAKTFLSQLV